MAQSGEPIWISSTVFSLFNEKIGNATNALLLAFSCNLQVDSQCNFHLPDNPTLAACIPYHTTSSPSTARTSVGIGIFSRIKSFFSENMASSKVYSFHQKVQWLENYSSVLSTVSLAIHQLLLSFISHPDGCLCVFNPTLVICILSLTNVSRFWETKYWRGPHLSSAFLS